MDTPPFIYLHIIGAMAEFERELIRERVKAGLENAKRKGKRLGRRPVPPVDMARIIELHQKDPELSVRRLAGALAMKKSTVQKTLVDFRAGLLDECGFMA